MPTIIWTEYLQYRADLRGFDLTQIEKILRYTDERYYDTETGRSIAVSSHNGSLVLIPYEETPNSITPVKIHATTWQQIRFRLKNGRYVFNE